jgi:hypothetical protein
MEGRPKSKCIYTKRKREREREHDYLSKSVWRACEKTREGKRMLESKKLLKHIAPVYEANII